MYAKTKDYIIFKYKIYIKKKKGKVNNNIHVCVFVWESELKRASNSLRLQ
jgi:hypothetical protein